MAESPTTDDFYNQNIGPLKGSYFGSGSGSLESQRNLENYYSRAVDPIRESIKKTEEIKMKAEKARQDIEAENERRKKAAKEAELEIAAQEKVDGAFGKLDTIRQTEDPVERQALLNKFKSSLSIADRQVSEIKAGIDLVQTGIDESEGETKTQREAKDSELEASANLASSRGANKKAKELANQISDKVKRDEILATISGKKSSRTQSLKSNFTNITKGADTALAALSKIEPSSVAQEPEDEGAKTGDTPGAVVTKAPKAEAPQGEALQGGDTSDEKPLFGGEEDSRDSTSKANQEIYRSARNAYFKLFGAEEADTLFKDDPDNMTAKELSDLFDTATKKVEKIKSQSISNKKFFRQFVPGEGILPLPEKPKKEDPEDPKDPKDPEDPKDPKDPEDGTFGFR